MSKWMARAGVFALFIVMCSFSSAAFAQDSTSLLSQYLDQSAASNKLPTGDGSISPVEQSVASALIDSVTGYNQTVTEFAQSSPDNSAWIAEAQQNIQNYNQKMEANATAPVDVRAQIISDAVAQYGQDVQTVTTQGTWDPRAQIISDAVAQYGQDIKTVQSSDTFDPRAAAISGAVAQYGQQLDTVQPPFDPRADAISKAVEQYGKSVEEINGQSGLSNQEKQAIKKTVKDTGNHYVDSTDSEYKELLKQHLQRLIDETLEDLPLDWVWPNEGIWVRKYGQGSMSGDCSGEGFGDNGGPDRDYYNEDDPGQQAQLCMSPSTGVVILDGNTFRWDRNGQPNTYITETSIDSYDNSSNQKVLSVIDDYNIDVVTTQTSGSCTVTNVVHYKLIIPGTTFGCSVNPEIHNVSDEMDQTPTDPTQDTQEPIVDPVIAGDYTVNWLPFDSSCPASLQPGFTQTTVTPISFDDVKWTINGQTYTLSGDGMRGEFSSYDGNLNLTLNRRFKDDFNVVWQASSDDHSQSCYAQGVAKLGTPTANQPNFQPPVQNDVPSDNNVGDVSSDGSSTSTDAPAALTTPPPAGDYTVSWKPMPGLACPSELQGKLPNFSKVTVSDVADDHFVLKTDSADYTIAMLPGASQWIFTQFGDDNSGVVISVGTVGGNSFSGTYSYFTPDGQACIMTIEATQ